MHEMQHPILKLQIICGAQADRTFVLAPYFRDIETILDDDPLVAFCINLMKQPS